MYVALSAGLLAVDIPFEVALAGTLALWLATVLWLRRRARRGASHSAGPRGAPAAEAVAVAEARPDGLPVLLKLVVIFVGAVLTALLGAVLRGMVVTFPYSGVLVAVEARRQLAEFSGHFARNSLALVGFLTAYHYLQDVSSGVALGAGWAAFAVVAVVLHLPLRPPGRAGAGGEPSVEGVAVGDRATDTYRPALTSSAIRVSGSAYAGQSRPSTLSVGRRRTPSTAPARTIALSRSYDQAGSRSVRSPGASGRSSASAPTRAAAAVDVPPTSSASAPTTHRIRSPEATTRPIRSAGRWPMPSSLPPSPMPIRYADPEV